MTTISSGRSRPRTYAITFADTASGSVFGVMYAVSWILPAVDANS